MNHSPKRRLDPAEVCTLPSPDFAERLAWIERVLLPHVVASQRADDARILELEDVPGLEGALHRWIEAERQCCDGMQIEAHPSRSPGRIRLEIRGIDPDAPVFHDLVVRPGAEAPPAWPSRLARSLGLGAAGALLLCCAAPLGATAVFGGSLAFLGALDAPGPIALVAGSGAWLVWRRLGRQGDRTRHARVGGACDSSRARGCCNSS